MADRDLEISELARALAHPARLRILRPRICHALDPAAFRPLAGFIDALTPPVGETCCLPDRKETA